MKFFHLGDLHFGKSLGDISLLEDQSAWIDALLEKADEEQPDAVVIAGDVYDRQTPATEAIRLYEKLIYGLAEREIPTLIIPGNHDNPIRLACTGELLKDHRIYVAGELTKQLQHVELTDADGLPVHFWLMPYLYPSMVEAPEVLDRDDLTSYDAAVRAMLALQPVDRAQCNVLVAHQNVLANGIKPEHSQSETIIGGLGEIDYTAFDAFDYVALGHIHNAQHIGRDSVRYSGCPLYYDFSEVNRKKPLTVVTISGKNRVEVRLEELPLAHKLLRPAGTFDEVMEAGKKRTDLDQYYVEVVLQGKDLPSNAIGALRSVYGASLANVKRELAGTDEGEFKNSYGAAAAEKPMEEQFGLFYKDSRGDLMDGKQEELLKKVLEQQEHSEKFYDDYHKVPEAESDSLLNYLLSLMEETE